MVSTNLMKLGKVKFELGLTGFSPEEQDVAALALVEQTGALKHIDNGNMDIAYMPWHLLGHHCLKMQVVKAYGNQTAKPLEKVLYATNEKEPVSMMAPKLNETNASKPSEVDKSKNILNEIAKIDLKNPPAEKKSRKNNK
jgi:hypothetical protein